MKTPKLEDFPDVLDVQQASIILNVSTKTVYKIIASGQLSTIKVGRLIRIPKKMLLDFLAVSHPNEPQNS